MRVVLGAVVVALVCAGTAGAARKPGTSEARAIRQAVAGYIAMPRSPAAKDNKIVSISVSTLDPRFASVRLSSKSAGPSDLVLHQSFGTWWVQEFGSSLGCDAGPKAVLDDLKVGCTPPAATAWINNCGPIVAAPKSLTLACADAGIILEKLRWSAWGKATTHARGSVVENDCTPNCAAGHFHSYPVAVTATKLTRCGRAATYRKLTAAFTGRRPKGAKPIVYTFAC